VALGGGTGLSTVLRGLKQHIGDPKRGIQRPISDLAAVVTVTDDGGSSGRLRRDYRVLPPGDIRNCMVALSKDEDLLGKLFQYRFSGGRGLAGHSFGNLFLTALTNITGDFPEAVHVSSRVLAIRGRIFPSTTENVTLEAELEDGSIVAGETRISRSKQRIRRIRLVPRRVRPLSEVLAALHDADLILVGPGSLYTSIIPNLLVAGVADAIASSRAKRVYICNLMTQPGETPNFKASDHVDAIFKHTKKKTFDWIVLNHRVPCAAVLDRYRHEDAEPVKNDVETLQRLGLKCVVDELLEEHGVIRHNSSRLARLLIDEFLQR